MIKKFDQFYAWLTGQRVVYLKDHDGEVTKTFAYKTPFGWVTTRYGIRKILLLEDGSIINGSYVLEWKWEEEK